MPFILMALMLAAQGMPIKNAHLGSEINKKEIQNAERQVDEAGCEDYRADWDLYAVCKKKGYPRVEAAKAVLHTDPWIRILPALPYHRNAVALTGSQSGTELPR